MAGRFLFPALKKNQPVMTLLLLMLKLVELNLLGVNADNVTARIY
jgi:hypothetical protein